MERAWLFAQSVFHYWGALVTGGVLIGVLAIWQNTDHVVWPWIYWAVAIIAFFVACFKAWNEQADLVEIRNTELRQLKALADEPKIGSEVWVEERKPASHVTRFYLLAKIYNEGEMISEINGEMIFQPSHNSQERHVPIQRQHLSKSNSFEVAACELVGQVITDQIRMRQPLEIPVGIRFSYQSADGAKREYSVRYRYVALERRFMLLE